MRPNLKRLENMGAIKMGHNCLGWDTIKKTIDPSNECWQEKLKVHDYQRNQFFIWNYKYLLTNN